MDFLAYKTALLSKIVKDKKYKTIDELRKLVEKLNLEWMILDYYETDTPLTIAMDVLYVELMTEGE